MAPSVDGPLLPSQSPQAEYRSKYCKQHAANKPLEWNTIARIAPQLRELAVEQLIRIWRRYESIDGHEALWGDEIEYFLADLKQQWFARPLYQQERVLKFFNSSPMASCFQPEFAKCCVESNPLSPYGSALESLLDVEPDMVDRRSRIKAALREGESVLTMPAFPTFGLQGGSPEKFISESAPAYALSRKNIRSRRRKEWEIRVPLFRDLNSPAFGHDVLIDDFVYGASQCCMQVTMQAKNIGAARQLYDQLIPLSPIMLALTAATPIYKRQLVNTDTRWNVLSALFDDRSPDELAQDQRARSRWSSNTTYLAQNMQSAGLHADDYLPMDSQVFTSLLAAGMDVALATHFAHILRYDPIKLMTSDIEDAKGNSSNLFELFNNSCYQGVRFKPPPGGDNAQDIGWRVEFRTMEVQLTDFENAAFAIFVYLAARVIVEFNLELHIPLKKVEKNFGRANTVNAVMEEKFWFRTSQWCSSTNPSRNNTSGDLPRPSHSLLSIDAIINGTGAQSHEDFRWPGFMPIISLYLSRRDVSPDTLTHIHRYLDLVSSRAAGTSPTAATWMRAFVRSHPDYQGDSEVPENVVYEMLKEIESMSS